MLYESTVNLRIPLMHLILMRPRILLTLFPHSVLLYVTYYMLTTLFFSAMAINPLFSDLCSFYRYMREPRVSSSTETRAVLSCRPSCSGNSHCQCNWIQKELLTFDILGSPTLCWPHYISSLPKDNWESPKSDSGVEVQESVGGRIILIRHVLYSLPIHLLSVMPVPRKVIDTLERCFADFLWGESEFGKRRHWMACSL